MDQRRMEIIKQLMAELQSEMEMSPDEMGERLGRPKVEVAIESEEPMEGDMEDPEAKFKQRLMKLRG